MTTNVVLIPCSLGCGHAIPVPMDEVAEASVRNTVVEVSHEPGKCPGERTNPAYTYRLRVFVDRCDYGKEKDEAAFEPMFNSGSGFVSGDTLPIVLPLLTERLAEQLQRVHEMQYLIENEEPDTQPV